MRAFKRIFITRYKNRILTALFWWGLVGAALLFYPAPASAEAFSIYHYVFFLPVFLAVLFTVHLLTGHTRRSVLIAALLVGLAILRLFRLATPINIVFLLIIGTAIEYWMHGRSKKHSGSRLQALK